MQLDNLADTVLPPAADASPEATYRRIEALSAQIAQSGFWLAPLKQEMRKAIIGQNHLLERLLVGLLSGGHMLLEGLPGLAKTLAVKTLARAMQTDFNESSSPRTCCRPTSSAPRSTTSSDTVFEVKQRPDLLFNLSWPMRSTGPRPRCSPPCSRPCRKSRLPSVTQTFCCLNSSW